MARLYAAGTATSSGFRDGLVGTLEAGTTITESYWDTQASGLATSAGGTGLTTTALQTISAFAGWDAARAWDFAAGQYPALRTREEPTIEAMTPAVLERIGGRALTITGTGFDGPGARILPDKEHVCAGDAVLDGDELSCPGMPRSKRVEWVRVLSGANRSSRARALLFPEQPLAGMWPGSGAASDPFLVADADDLLALHAIAGDHGEVHVELTADISLSGRRVSPIDLGYTALTLEGAGHSISGFVYTPPLGIGVRR